MEPSNIIEVNAMLPWQRTKSAAAMNIIYGELPEPAQKAHLTHLLALDESIVLRENNRVIVWPGSRGCLAVIDPEHNTLTYYKSLPTALQACRLEAATDQQPMEPAGTQITLF